MSLLSRHIRQRNKHPLSLFHSDAGDDVGPVAEAVVRSQGHGSYQDVYRNPGPSIGCAVFRQLNRGTIGAKERVKVEVICHSNPCPLTRLNVEMLGTTAILTGFLDKSGCISNTMGETAVDGPSEGLTE